MPVLNTLINLGLFKHLMPARADERPVQIRQIALVIHARLTAG